MIRADELYTRCAPKGIPIAFDCRDPEQEEALDGFVAAFGERYTWTEDLGLPRRYCLTILPGGARRLVR